MTYPELLLQKEWFEKCNVILQRDMHRCKRCGCLGYHNGTIYSTDSLEEVERIINSQILLGDTFSSLIEQTFAGTIKCDQEYYKNKYFKVDGKDLPIEETDSRFLLEKIYWEVYNDAFIQNKESFEDKFLYKIWLFNPKSVDFKCQFAAYNSPKLVTQINVDSLDFKLHKYKKFINNNNNEIKDDCTTLILLFEQELSDKYYLCIENDGISLTYKNYVFYVSLIPSNFVYKGLNIHHKYYVNGLKPWEYDNDALVTLCEECHKKIHETPVPKYKSRFDMTKICDCIRCTRCSGSGYLPQYNHVQHGICFKCGGEGVIVD